MKKVFLNSTHCGAVEADTISKNGRSTKSLMNKRFFLRAWTKGVMFALLYFAQFSLTQAQEVTEPQIVKFGMNRGTPVVDSSTDHLEPELGFFEIDDRQVEYYTKVRSKLFNGLTVNPEIRFQVMPSFSPENVLDIEFDRNNNKYYLIYHICKEKIWNHKNWKNIKVDRFKTEIDKKSVELIQSLFFIAVNQAKRPHLEIEIIDGPDEQLILIKGLKIPLDGTRYYFTATKYYKRSGVTHSPVHGSKMKKLVDIGYELIELAKSQKEIVEFDEELQEKIEKLIEELK